LLLATKRVDQKGMAAARSTKYAIKSNTFDYTPNCEASGLLVVKRIKIRPVATLIILAANIISPEYWSQTSFLSRVRPAFGFTNRVCFNI
jgi:hypothetical protein